MNDKADANIGRIAAKGSVWATASNLIGRLIAFVTTMVMARLLSPADFGVVAIGLFCIGLLDSLRNFGVGEALIYRQRDGDTDSNTAFWIAIAVGVFLTLTAWTLSPLAAGFFDNDDATGVIAALSVIFVIESLMIIHATRAQRDFQFARRAVADITKTVFKAVISISLALTGFGLWSLVIGQISGAIAGAICYWIVVPWRPKLEFNYSAARGLMSYGQVLICLGAVAYAINRADQFSIGRHLDAEWLGYYAVAFSMVDLLVANPARTIGQASFSAFSKLAGNRQKLKQNYLDTVLFVSLLCVALGAGIFATAPSMVEVFLTSKWSPSVPVIQVLAFFAMAHAIAYSAGDVLKAVGKAKFLVWTSVVWLLVSVSALWLIAPHGIVPVACAVFVFQFIASIVVTAFCMKLLELSVSELLNNIKPAVTAGLTMIVVLEMLLPLITASVPPILRLCAEIGVGAVTYIGVIRWMRPDVVERILWFTRIRARGAEA